MIVINLVLFIGLMLLARDLQSLVSNGFNDFCVHRSLKKERVFVISIAEFVRLSYPQLVPHQSF